MRLRNTNWSSAIPVCDSNAGNNRDSSMENVLAKADDDKSTCRCSLMCWITCVRSPVEAGRQTGIGWDSATARSLSFKVASSFYKIEIKTRTAQLAGQVTYASE